jgi:hypothetical protein
MKLQNCPDCGAPAKLTDMVNRAWVACTECSNSTGAMINPESAAREWNGEPQPPLPSLVRLYACPECRRVLALFNDEQEPERCGAAKQVTSTRGVLGTFTTYCSGIPVRCTP